MRKWFWVSVVALLASCRAAKEFKPTQKYAPEVVRKDYRLFRSILEDSHPGLYWYTPKDSMDRYFERGAAMLGSDSMTETRFRAVLSYVLAQLHCGHTYARPSKAFIRAAGDGFSYPIALKFWPDTAVVTDNRDRRDSQLTAGSILTSIDGRPVRAITDTLFRYLSGDGYNRTHLFQTLSNRGGFGNAYIPVFGYKPKYRLEWTDTLGAARTAMVNLFLPSRDSSRRGQRPSMPRGQRKRLLRNAMRRLRVDSTVQTAFLDLGTFTKGYGLRGFFRRSFRNLRKAGVSNLVIDLRGNGGGSVTNSNLLTKYIADHRFKIADSLFAVRRNSRYLRYQSDGFWNNLFLVFLTHRRADGNYHFRYFERHYFEPKKKNHYNGQVYVLTGGNTFSASTLFAGAVRGQPNVTIVGEETGGGAYGNNAWLIPDVTLPGTGVRFRLPLFRLVIDSNGQKGSGVQPEVFAGPSVEAIREGRDYKMDKVLELIREREKERRSL